MILPPFFAISIPRDEEIVKRALVDYVAFDTLSFQNPFPGAVVSYQQIDVLSLPSTTEAASVTYMSMDVVSLPLLSTEMSVTLNAADVLYYRPPPELPLTPEFLSFELGDEYIDLSWSTPYDNRCSITGYVLEFSDCSGCSWQLDSIISANTGQVDNLINGTGYQFRIAAINCVGTGQYGYSNILTPFGTNHVYCDIALFLQPNSSDIYASMSDYSCDTKDLNYLAGVSASTSVSKFGAGSFYFDGVYEGPPYTLDPGTYSHIYVQSTGSQQAWGLYDDFTIELWFRPDSSYASSTQTFLSAYSQDPNYNNSSYWKLYRYQNQVKFNLTLNLYDINTGNYLSDSLTMSTADLSIPTTGFTHLAVCRSSGIIRIFVDGIQEDKKTFSANIPVTGEYMVIGADQGDFYLDSDYNNIQRYAVSQPYIGYVDDIMISTSARYRKSFTPTQYTATPDCTDCP